MRSFFERHRPEDLVREDEIGDARREPETMDKSQPGKETSRQSGCG
jgi:hypothetical protein